MFVRNALRVTTAFGYALILLTIVNETEGQITIFDKCDQTEGFFFAPGTGLSQCLKVIRGYVSWEGAKAKCSAEGLVMARPFNALALRQYLFERFSLWNFWVDARGDGNRFFRWQTARTGAHWEVASNSPLWAKDPPDGLSAGNKVSSSDCMALETHPSNINAQPEKVYSPLACSNTNQGNTLCERILTP